MLATLYVVIAATVGASLIFPAAKTVLGDSLRLKAGPWLRRMEDGFRESALNYLVFLRMISVFLFRLVNLVPAFSRVAVQYLPHGHFLWDHSGSLVYASFGNRLGTVFDPGDTPDLGTIFKPAIILPIIGLALLAILSVAYKKIRGRQTI